MTPGGQARRTGFTLIELALVLLIIGTVTGMAMLSGVAVVKSARFSATRKKMAEIDRALMSYRAANDRLPCPADLTIAEGSTNFGVEGATAGTCTGGTPAANSSAAGATNASTTAVEGALPVVTLGMPNDYMYDGWGNRFRYAVDKGLTATGAFTTITTACINRAITVKDASGNTITSGAIYAVLSHGENGHGAYTRKGVIQGMGSTNGNEQTDCHCDSSAAASTYTATYVQGDPTSNSASATDSFDDLVTYRERWQMMTAWEKSAACVITQYIYVVDYGNNRVMKYDLNGNFLQGFGASYGGVSGSVCSSGSGDGQLLSPLGVAVDTAGNVYISDRNHRIQKYDSTGHFLRKYGGSVGYTCSTGGIDFSSQTSDIEIDGSGNVWFSVPQNNCIMELDSNLGFLKGVTPAVVDGPYNYNAVGLGIDPNGGYIYTVQPYTACNLYKWDSTATNVLAKGTYGNCGAGNGQFDTSGGGGDYLTVDATGNIWVVDEPNARIQKFNSSLVYQSQITGLTNVVGVSFDSSGYLYTSDEGNHRISKYTTAGVPVNSFNSGTQNYFGNNGCGNTSFSNPIDVYISSYR